MEPAKLPQVISNMTTFITTKKPDVAIIETHGAQEAIAISIREHLDAMNCRIPLHPFDNGPNSKEGFIIMMLAEGIRRGKIRIKDNKQGKLVMRQLAQFPSGKHDDGPDAAAILISLLNQLAA
jgi:hypothetical protein